MTLRVDPARARAVRFAPLLAGSAVFALAVAVAATHVVATAGGRDQTLFHLPTILHMRDSFPSVDVVDVNTATSPLLHLTVAAVTAIFGLGPTGSQIVSSLFAVVLAMLVSTWAAGLSLRWQILVVAPLLCSAYFWQSALWINTDDAALLFAAATVFALYRVDRFRPMVMIGILAALTVATRQTYAWVLVPIAAVALEMGRSTTSRARLLAVGCGPAAVVLVALVVAWKGFTPPAFAELNGIASSGSAVSYGFAIVAFFAVPTLLCTIELPAPRRLSRTAIGVGLLATLPALFFDSSRSTDDSRNGGWVWAVVGKTPTVLDRSPFLVLAAFVGGVSAVLVLEYLPRRLRLFIGTGLVSAFVILTFGSRLYQRYFELPTAMLCVLAVAYLARTGKLKRVWPLAALASIQVILTVGIVAYPTVHAALRT